MINKKKFLALISAVSVLGATAQEIPNGSFENWTYDAEYDVYDPVDFLNFNACGKIGDVSNCVLGVTKSSDAVDGTTAIKVETVADASNDPADAFVTTIDLNRYQPIATTEKPDKLYGFYKSSILGEDVAIIKVEVGTGDFSFDNPTLIGSGSLEISSSQSEYLKFEIPITYTSSEASSYVVVTMKSAKEESSETIGTYILVDAISFDDAYSYNVINALQNTEHSYTVYPNPSTKSVYVKTNGEFDYTIFSLNGAVVAKGFSAKSIDVSNIEAGIYNLEIITNTGSRSQKLVVTK